MNKYIITIILITSPLWLIAQTSDRGQLLSLEMIWDTIDSQNKNIQLSDLELKESNLEILLAKDNLLPDLSLKGNIGLNTKMPVYNSGLLSKPDYFPVSKYGYSFGYQFDFNIYNGGKDSRNITIKKEENIRQQNNYNLQRNNIRYASAIAYYDLYKFLQFKDFLFAEITSEKKQLATIESLYKNGIVLKSDVLRATVKLSQLELSYSDIEKKIDIAKQRLNILMGKNNEENIEITNEQINIPDNLLKDTNYIEYVNLALEKSPEYKIILNDITISELTIKQIKADQAPKVSLYSGYNYTYPQSSFYPYSRNIWGYGQTGIKLSLSLDNFYRNKHKVAKAKNESLQETKRLQIKKDELTVDIKEAHAQQIQAIESVKTAEENIIQNTESVRIIRNSYLNQESMLTDLLDAENILLEAKFALTSAKINVLLSHIKLLVKTGIL